MGEMAVTGVEGLQTVYGGLGAHHLQIRTLLIVHVVHVVIGGVGGDMELGGQGRELQELVVHREDAADDDCRLRVDIRLTGEDLWEALEHASCDTSVLLSAEERELTLPAAPVVAHGLDDGEHLTAARCELAEAVGMGQGVERSVEGLIADEPA